MSNNVIVELSEKAVEEIKKIRVANNIPESYGLRLGIISGGCRGISYLLGFEEKAKEKDIIYQTHGLSIFMDLPSTEYLTGAQLDFYESGMGKSFVFRNVKHDPNQDANRCGNGYCENC